jgi:integral membrane protein
VTEERRGAEHLSRGTLIRYRVMAYVTGVLLLGLVFVAIPVQVFGNDETPVAILGTAHGYLYMVYLVTAFLLAYRLRWSLTRTLLLLLAGTVPFMSFVAERAVMRQLTREQQLTPSD